MKKITLLLTLFLGLLSIENFAQSDETTFTVSVSADSVYFGNKFKVTFTLENGQGENFIQPEFADFKQLGGQTMSSRMSIINGAMSQTSAYSYYLEPKEIGGYFIEPASIIVDGKVYETALLEIFILANPDGIKQEIEEDKRNNNSFFDEFDMTFPPAPNWGNPERRENEKKKRKRKTTRL